MSIINFETNTNVGYYGKIVRPLFESVEERIKKRSKKEWLLDSGV